MLQGIDVSKWQGEMNWSKARSAGARYAFIRAGAISSSGVNYKDFQFERNAAMAPDYMPIGFYWFFRPQHYPEGQANYFSGLIRGKKAKLPPVIDLEDEGGLSPEAVTVATSTMARQLYHRLGEWPLLYSRGIWLNDHTITDPIWALLRLWIARYKDTLTGPWSDGYCKPRDYETWDFWQHSADGNGKGAMYGAKSFSIGLNWFNGGEKEFSEYIGEAAPRTIKITSNMAKVGSGPESEAVGVTWRGRTWPLVGTNEDYYQVTGWIKKDSAEIQDA